jgi:hypothetical protein
MRLIQAVKPARGIGFTFELERIGDGALHLESQLI